MQWRAGFSALKECVLISLYAFFAYPEYFGCVGAMSPSLWFARGRIMGMIKRSPPILGMIYLDYGTAEGARSPADSPWIRTLLSRSTTMDGELYALLLAKGYRPDRDVRYVAAVGAEHSEAAWARRLPDALRFLLSEESLTPVRAYSPSARAR
jgi:predicted alpha/beta superfamily hydrolase